ncbi:MAG: pentapeptide repeat-containing protein [Planctomycetales bacterium]|nr:pentapeptide repeat-containing protein [Planctomycetales bacterium]
MLSTILRSTPVLVVFWIVAILPALSTAQFIDPLFIRTVTGEAFPGVSEDVCAQPNAVLANLDLRHATCLGERGVLSKISFAGSNLSGSTFSFTTISNVDFSNTILDGATFGRGRLRNVNFSGALISNAAFYEGSFSNLNFSNARLRNTWFDSDSSYLNIDLSNAFLQNVTLPPGTAKEHLYATGSYAEKTLHGIGFYGMDVSNWDFSGQDLSNSNFERTNLTNADFSDAKTSGVVFTRSNLSQEQLASTWNYANSNFASVSLDSMDLRNWDFRGMDISGLNLSDSNLGGVDLSNAKIDGASFSYAEGFELAQLYSTASYAAKQLNRIGLAKTNLDSAEFSGTSFVGADLGLSSLVDANLSGANLSDASLTLSAMFGTNLSNTTARRSDLHGSWLAFADMSHGSFIGSNFTDAHFSNVNLDNADLSNADLRLADNFQPADSTVTRNMIWPDASMRGLELDQGDVVWIRWCNACARNRIAPNLGAEINVSERFDMKDGTLDFEITPSWEVSTLTVSSDAEIELGGTLRISATGRLNPYTPTTVQLFKWPAPLSSTNRFDSIETPPNTRWDFSELYTTGRATVQPINPIRSYSIDGLMVAIKDKSENLRFDLDGSNTVDFDDLRFEIENNWQTSFGDANLDGRFDTKDLVAVFQANQYEDNIPWNSGWSTGDWNGDGDFDSADLRLAFQSGKWESDQQVVRSVPEPRTSVSLALFAACIATRFRRFV